MWSAGELRIHRAQYYTARMIDSLQGIRVMFCYALIYIYSQIISPQFPEVEEFLELLKLPWVYAG
jgi:hypothetical protein